MVAPYNKVLNTQFEALLHLKDISKKEFAGYSGIPYDTVAGWKKKGKVPTYAMVILKQMPTHKKSVTANDLIKAGIPQAILWNNQGDKEVPIDIFIVSILQKAYNDFVVETVVEYFGTENVLTALLLHRERVSDRLVKEVTNYLQERLKLI